MATENKDFFDEIDEKKPKVIVQKKLPPQDETMDLPDTEPKEPARRRGRPPQTESKSPALPAKPGIAPDSAAAPKQPRHSPAGSSRKGRPVTISEDTYWAIRKKLVDLRKDIAVEEALEEAVRLWIRQK